MMKEEIGVFQCSRSTRRPRTSAFRRSMLEPGSIRPRKSENCSSLSQARRALATAGETLTRDSDRQGTSKVSAAMRRKSPRLTLSRETTRMLPASGQPTITTAVYTIIPPMRIARRLVEQEKQAGWRTDSHKIIIATTTQGIPIRTEVYKFATKMSMAALSIACKEERTQ